jgi:hypothetical protein
MHLHERVNIAEVAGVAYPFVAVALDETELRAPA